MALPLRPDVLAVALYFALVPTGIAYGAYFLALRAAAPVVAALSALLEPLTAAVLSAVLLHDRLGVTGWTGAALLVSALAVSHLRARPPVRSRADNSAVVEKDGVTLINVIELPADQVESFVRQWRVRAALMRDAPGFRDSRLHQARLSEARFQLVNVAHGDSAEDLEAAKASPAFQELPGGVSAGWRECEPRALRRRGRLRQAVTYSAACSSGSGRPSMANGRGSPAKW